MANNENQNSNGASSSTTNSNQVSNISTSVLSSLVFNTPIKLTNNNYLLWHSQVVATINANDLEDLIDSSKTPPNRMMINIDSDQTVITSPNPQFQIWRRNDQQLMSQLLSTLSEEVLSAIVGARSSLDVWQILATQFGARSRARVLHLRTQIQTTRKGSTIVHEYYTKMKTTIDALRSAGSNMSDEDFVLCLLASLGYEYDSIVTTINAQPEGTSLSNVYEMLLSHENRIEYHHSVSHMDYQANLAYHRGNQMRIQQPNFNFGGNNNNYSGRLVGSSNGKQPGGNNFNRVMNPSEKFKGKNPTDEEEPKGLCHICFKKIILLITAGTGSRRIMCLIKYLT